VQAFQVTTFGEGGHLVQIDTPKPAADEVLLRIEACGLNFADILMEKGQYQETPEPPFTLGMEVAGIVEETGAEVSHLKPGQRVALFAGSGGLAEYGCFPARRCLPLPDEMSFETAAAFQIAYGTSHLALIRRARLQAGETVLVLGAAGGVGLTAVELARLSGARVVAVARGADKLEVARKAGADVLIDSATDDLTAIVKDLGGADVVYDPVGGAPFKAALRACKPEARVVVIGFASGDIPQIPANIILVKNITVIGHYWGGYLRFAPQVLTDSLNDLIGMYEAGRLHPHVSHVLPLARAGDALDLLRARKSTGKVVVRPQPEAGRN